MSLQEKSTFRLEHATRVEVRRFRLVVLEGPDLPGGARNRSWMSTSDRCAIGRSPANDVVLDDPKVSQHHCELEIDDVGVRIRDLGSRNGTRVDGVQVESALLAVGNTIQVGNALLRFETLEKTSSLPLSQVTEFGSLVGSSASMRACFVEMEQAAKSDATVLLLGETGTGKTAAAEAIHARSARRGSRMVVVDCSTIAPTLVEAELFGSVKGAYTGATDREGPFEEAHKSTLFLDEIAELPLGAQAKLLRAIENRRVKRVGGTKEIEFDVRLIAATHKDLRDEMNAGRFRSDLFYRLDVLHVRVPPLRKRIDDIPLLVERLLDGLGTPAETRAKLCTSDFYAELRRSSWPGNIRELRNYVERCTVHERPLPLSDESAEADGCVVDARKPFAGEKERFRAAFERAYITQALQLHKGNVAAVARCADLSRQHIYRLMDKYGVSSND